MDLTAASVAVTDKSATAGGRVMTTVLDGNIWHLFSQWVLPQRCCRRTSTMGSVNAPTQRYVSKRRSREASELLVQDEYHR